MGAGCAAADCTGGVPWFELGMQKDPFDCARNYAVVQAYDRVGIRSIGKGLDSAGQGKAELIIHLANIWAEVRKCVFAAARGRVCANTACAIFHKIKIVTPTR